jgi:predicted methyltransferase
MVVNMAWCLPRPREDKYPGGFPLHFERRLLDVLHQLGAPRDMTILHPFGGHAEYGLTIDICPGASPAIIGDAHQLPVKSGTFDAVILDPPYSNEESLRLYNTGPLHPRLYLAEGARVLKPGGFLVVYHTHTLPGAPGCHLRARILVETRVGHLARIVHVRQKDNFKQGALL